jgi:cell division protein FtsW (lipid II flippase)
MKIRDTLLDFFMGAISDERQLHFVFRWVLFIFGIICTLSSFYILYKASVDLNSMTILPIYVKIAITAIFMVLIFGVILLFVSIFCNFKYVEKLTSWVDNIPLYFIIIVFVLLVFRFFPRK